MSEYIEVSEKTLDDCITTACQKLSVTSDRLDYEVIDQGSAGFLGFNARKAVIRARVKESSDKVNKVLGDVLSRVEEKAEVKKAESAAEKIEKAVEAAVISEKIKEGAQAFASAKDTASEAAKEFFGGNDQSEEVSYKARTEEEQADFLRSTVDEFGFVDVEARAAALPPSKEPAQEKSFERTYSRSYDRDGGRRDRDRGRRNDRNSRSSSRSRDRYGDRRRSEGNYFEIVEDEGREIPVYDPKADRHEPKVDYTDEQIAQFKERADEFLTAVFGAMGIEVEINTSFDKSENILTVDFEGDDMGILIGKRGATLDSLQYLVSLVVNKGVEGYVHVKADTENYRERRKKTLENLAKNIAYKVKKTRKSMALEPMNPYERRIIHSALQGDKFVTTYSEGEDPNRRVVVTLKK